MSQNAVETGEQIVGNIIREVFVEQQQAKAKREREYKAFIEELADEIENWNERSRYWDDPAADQLHVNEETVADYLRAAPTAMDRKGRFLICDAISESEGTFADGLLRQIEQCLTQPDDATLGLTIRRLVHNYLWDKLQNDLTEEFERRGLE